VRAARAMNAARVPPRTIAAKLLPPPVAFKVDALLAASRQWSDQELQAAMVALDRADRGIKNGGDAWAALSVAVVEACGRTAPGIRPGARPSR